MDGTDPEDEAAEASSRIRRALANAMHRHPLDVGRICALAGVSRSSVYAFISGKRDIRLETLLRLHSFLIDKPRSNDPTAVATLDGRIGINSIFPSLEDGEK